MNFWKSCFGLVLGVVVCNSHAAMEFKEADITTVKNIVERNEGAGSIPAKVNDKITENSIVSTATSSMAELTFADSSITRMGSNTQFSFKSKERLVKLEQGTILIHTPPGNGGATVEAGGVTAAVTGTTFMASHDTAGNVLFVLLEGQGGLKVTVGGATTVIRPGQAASVGAEIKKEAGGGLSAEKASAGPATATAASGGEEKTPGQGSGPAPTTGGGDTGGTPPPATPKIQVFDIDVKRVVTTSPLVVDFKAELPSASKIEKTIEVQQQAVKEGKLEKLEVEAVAVKSGDGDLLVGAPKLEKEEFVVVNKKIDLVGQSQGGGDGLDIETAAGPGAGTGTGGGMAASPVPRAEAPTPPPVVSAPVNPGQTAIQQPPAPEKVAVTARVNNSSRVFNQANPVFGFTITSGSLLAGHSLVADFLTSATTSSGVAGSPYTVNFSNPRILDGSGADVTSRYNLTTVAGVLNVLKASQNVSFGSLGSLTYNQSANLVANALGGTVTFQVISGPGTIGSNGRLVATSGTGSVVVRAATTGDQNYSGAFVDQTITLAKAVPALNAQGSGSTANGNLVASLAGQFGGGITLSALENDGRVVADSTTGAIALGRTLANSATIRLTSAGNDNYQSGFADLNVSLAGPTPAQREAANPARRLLQTPGITSELEALDKFFFYQAKANDFTGDAPSAFFTTTHQAKNLNLGQVESLGRLTQLYSSQTSDYFFMGNLTAGTAAVPDVNLQNRDRVIFADTIRIDPTVASATTISDFPGAKIPDGNLTGLARNLDLSSQGLSTSFSWFVDQVSLRIDGDPSAFGAFNGDFVSYLRHTKSSGDTATVTLLDRIGSTPLVPEGSSDNGLSVTFSDFGNSAIHQAQSVVSGGAITGTYQPDRGTTLLTAGFGPVDPLGQFTLATFDASSGAEGFLTSWSVELVQRLAISLDNGAGKNFSLVAGNGGLFLKNTLWDLGGTQAEFTTTGNLFLESDSFFFPGNSLRMEAAGSAELVDVKVLGNAAAGSEVVVRARQDVTLTDTAIKAVGGQIEVASLNGSVRLLAPDQLLGGTSPSAETKHVELQAEKAVKITGATVVELDTSAGAKPSTIPVSTTPNSGPQNLAVVRSGDSLELRNVVIRGFHGTRLENGAGRVLMSGSSVRDFKIKELTGMAVNADAKIQMAAYDSAGRLEGEMVVEQGLPVATRVASAVAAAQGTPLEVNDAPGDTPVHADVVDLAARTVRFNGATIAAMNSITARANTIVVQGSFMTVVQNTGMINMYVSSGLVNQSFGSVVDGRLNFAGLNTFTIGNNSFAIGNQTQLNAAYGTNLIEIPSGGTPQAGKVNVLRL